MDGVDFVMDLSVRNSSSLVLPTSTSSTPQPGSVSTIVRPIPRPPWSIVWYQNLWSSFSTSAESLEGGESKNGQVFDCFRERSVENANYAQNTNVLPRNQQHSRQFRVSVSTEAHDVENGGEGRSLSSSSSHLPSYYKGRETQYCNKTSSSSQQPDWENNNENKEPCSSDIEDEEADGSTHIVVTSSTADSVSSSCSSSNMNETNNGCNSSSAISLGKVDLRGNLGQNHNNDPTSSSSIVLDIACCDGPVQFKRVSNPNFALTVEHSDVGTDSVLDATKGVATNPTQSSDAASNSPENMNQCAPEGSSRTSNSGVAQSCTTSTSAATTSLKTYLCIYCNQSFKSLFCYQKHKKRHLNPVSVDITTTTTMSNQIAPRAPSHHHSSGGATVGGSGGVASASRGGTISESTKAKMKDLNVQFFPCKKCGCKFPSYYFVHKHRKICH